MKCVKFDNSQKLKIMAAPEDVYKFVPGSMELEEQTTGLWIASFDALIYSGQSYNEVKNELKDGVRYIVFEVEGQEAPPIITEHGESAEYQRGPESEVELVLARNGKIWNTTRNTY